jgi:GT2 family glycosyltransferase
MTSASPQPDVSIVIVSFNTLNVLRECLQSIERESDGLNVEIWVVDNNSSDGSPEMIDREFPYVQLVRSPTNLGFGGANNLALEKARGRYIVLLNSDAFFCPNALRLAVQHMDEHPHAGLGGAQLVGRDQSWQPSGRMFPTVLNDAFVYFGLASRYPAFFLYSEEVDLCRRIKAAGYQIWYWPDIVVIHIGGESSRQVKTLEMSSTGAQLIRWRMRSTLLYYRKHHGFVAWWSKALELTLYKLIVWRNSFSRDPRRKARAQEHRNLAILMRQAWQDTAGGRVSPPRPW